MSSLSADVWLVSWMTETGHCRLHLYCVLFRNSALWGRSQAGNLMQQRQRPVTTTNFISPSVKRRVEWDHTCVYAPNLWHVHVGTCVCGMGKYGNTHGWHAEQLTMGKQESVMQNFFVLPLSPRNQKQGHLWRVREWRQFWMCLVSISLHDQWIKVREWVRVWLSLLYR